MSTGSEVRKQFTFYGSFYDAVSQIKNKAARAEAYDAICKYALYNTLPDLDKMPDTAAIAFMLIKPNLDASRKKAEAGRNGGNRKQTGSKPEANDKQEQTASKPEANRKREQTATEKEKEKENENEIENDCYPPNPLPPAEKASRKQFEPPTVEMVADYCREKGYGVDPEAFVAFYASKGWLVGKEKMQDWKAAVLTWVKRDRRDAAKPQPGARVLDPDEAEAIRRMMGVTG